MMAETPSFWQVQLHDSACGSVGSEGFLPLLLSSYLLSFVPEAFSRSKWMCLWTVGHAWWTQKILVQENQGTRPWRRRSSAPGRAWQREKWVEPGALNRKLLLADSAAWGHWICLLSNQSALRFFLGGQRDKMRWIMGKNGPVELPTLPFFFGLPFLGQKKGM